MIVEGNYIKAEEGKILYNGEITATEVFLGKNDAVDNWTEIDENTPMNLLEEIRSSIKKTDEQKEIEKLKAQIEAQSEQMDFYESCIAEMAEYVYA